MEPTQHEHPATMPVRAWWRRRRGWAIALLAVVVVATPLTAYAMTSGTSPAKASAVSTSGFPSGPNDPGIFTDRCGYSHEAADDPILAPNDPGAAMHHNFYGNTTTSSSSTAKGLVGGATKCTTMADASAYWTPVMYQNGKALTPSTALIYWRRPARDTAAIQAIPAGLQLIAGNETATTPQSTSVIAWTCAAKTARTKPTAVPHDCVGSQLRLVVTFPSCWDGHTLAGARQTNVVYRTSGGCPADHPVQIPQIVFHVNYPTASASGLTLSMTPTMQGSTDTEHVDFINGWNQTILSRDVAACDATSTRCGPVTGAQAVPKGGKTDRKAHKTRMHKTRH